jgi:hypothetical protein
MPEISFKYNPWNISPIWVHRTKSIESEYKRIDVYVFFLRLRFEYGYK